MQVGRTANHRFAGATCSLLGVLLFSSLSTPAFAAESFGPLVLNGAGDIQNGRVISGPSSKPVSLEGPLQLTATGGVRAMGLIGRAGATGQTGLQGLVGATGVTGAPGAQGLQGPVGPAGPQGFTGATGLTGATGATGAQGPVGATGMQGPVGPQGATGAQGPAGPQGATGAQGPAGPAGASGTAQPICVSPGGSVKWGACAGGGTTYNMIIQ